MSNEMALWLAIVAGALAVLFGIISSRWILRQPAGNDRMQQIAKAIQDLGTDIYCVRFFEGIRYVYASLQKVNLLIV